MTFFVALFSNAILQILLALYYSYNLIIIIICISIVVIAMV